MNTCRICSCTDLDCTWCWVLDGIPCAWIEPNLCSTCHAFGPDDVTRARERGRYALRKANRRSGRAPGFLELSGHGREMLRVCHRIERDALDSAARARGCCFGAAGKHRCEKPVAWVSTFDGRDGLTWCEEHGGDLVAEHARAPLDRHGYRQVASVQAMEVVPS